MTMKTLQQLLDEGVEDRHILVRSDFNVPLDEDGNITDAGRIDASLPTLKALLEGGAKVIVMAHLGRPKGEVNPKFSLKPVAEALSERLGQFVALAGDVSGEDAHERANGLTGGEILLLENVRFDPRETSKDEAERTEFAAELVALAADNGAFVSDGFGVVHRAQTSVYDVAKKLPAYAGYLVEKEVKTLSKVKDAPDHPYVVVLGGSKVSDKLGVIEALAAKADKVIIGGGMCYTFLAAQGYNVQNSLLQEDMIETCKDLIGRFGDKLLLPEDLIAASEFAKDAEKQTVAADAIPEGWMSLDIGPKTAARYGEALKSSKTVFWNGPMGVFEFPAFASGTKAVAEAMIAATKDNGSFTVVGGGDSAASVRILGLDEAGFSHISTGGGASLELIEGKELPGVAVLGQ
ncbi:phosphoglycerate kinase [Corynebacterium sp. NML98-0116]|uniref:Phosphoglycerate kinase n=1 Tax=Corynebacterium lipophilum TaxID=2804918 RepID=A0AAW5HQB3_9CORY|nr:MULTISPECIES: phosphoglycerate kinase [Corynebacterium]AOX05556.1 phosphoglycerate kinase [Corynebacterium sp. NML98-0116]MCO6393663.1 phosphoglycerate kinase [Corynebacterium lipophilum]MCQ4607857.1 phosphoglycerate kinase [Corynebacterium pseudogenitalium]MCQ4609149.1 phosphoglycerate kinase [Corynebacterium sp. CCUG 61414]MCQ4611244.1 phosphoglycerate kinase [Corynebacterium sp. CCUG 51687]